MAFDSDVSIGDTNKEDNDNTLEAFVVLYNPIFDLDHVIATTLHHFWLTNVFSLFDADLGVWVKSKSTTWFSKYLLAKYNDDWWIHLFCMTKSATFVFVNLLKPWVD